MAYLIEFRYPERTLWAGKFKDGLGWAPTPDTALRFDSEEVAGRTLANGYGPSAEYGFIVDENDAEVTA